MLIYLCEDSESDALRLKHHLNTYATKHHCNMEILLYFFRRRDDSVL